MKLSFLIKHLEKLKDEHGDKHILVADAVQHTTPLAKSDVIFVEPLNCVVILGHFR